MVVPPPPTPPSIRFTPPPSPPPSPPSSPLPSPLSSSPPSPPSSSPPALRIPEASPVSTMANLAASEYGERWWKHWGFRLITQHELLANATADGDLDRLELMPPSPPPSPPQSPLMSTRDTADDAEPELLTDCRPLSATGKGSPRPLSPLARAMLRSKPLRESSLPPPLLHVYRRDASPSRHYQTHRCRR